MPRDRSQRWDRCPVLKVEPTQFYWLAKVDYDLNERLGVGIELRSHNRREREIAAIGRPKTEGHRWRWITTAAFQVAEYDGMTSRAALHGTR